MPKGKKAGASKLNSASNGGISKWDAVQEALSTLGKDAMPLVIQEYVQEKHGLDLDTSLISNYKSNLLKQGGGKKQGGRKKRGRPTAARAASSGGISLEDIRAVKQLADRIGVDKVQELAAVLAR